MIERFDVTPRECAVYHSFCELIAEVAVDGWLQTVFDATAPLDGVSLDELLVAYAVLLTSGPRESRGTHYERTARNIVGKELASASDEEALLALVALYRRSSANAGNVACETIFVARPWGPGFFSCDLLLELPWYIYDILSNGTNPRPASWKEFIMSKLETPSATTQLQHDLAAVLADDWNDTGRSLIETVRSLAITIP